MKTVARNRHFGEWLEAELDDRGLSQSAFARRISSDAGTVSHWVHGRRMPSPESCRKLADALNVNRDSLLALAGHRAMEDTPDPLAPELALMAKIKRIRWTDTQVQLVGGLLDDLTRLYPKEGKQQAANGGTVARANPRTGLAGDEP